MTQDDLDLVKQTRDAFMYYLNLALADQEYKIVPVGSLSLSCLITLKPELDFCIYMESNTMTANGTPQMQEIDLQDLRFKLDEVFKAKVPEFPKVLFAVDDLHFRKKSIARGLEGELGAQDMTSVLVIKNLGSLDKQLSLRLFPIGPVEQSCYTSDRALIGLYHSHWLIEEYNKASEAWQSVKLLKLVRIWRYALIIAGLSRSLIS